MKLASFTKTHLAKMVYLVIVGNVRMPKRKNTEKDKNISRKKKGADKSGITKKEAKNIYVSGEKKTKCTLMRLRENATTLIKNIEENIIENTAQNMQPIKGDIAVQIQRS